MLTRPDIPDSAILSLLQADYDLRASGLSFLPLGADVNTAVFRIVTPDGRTFFLKLRKGDFAEINVAVPQFLAAQGISEIIAPLTTLTGQLWTSLPPYKMVLYPYIEGLNGYRQDLSDAQWLKFGAALQAIHTAKIPPALARLIPCENYSPYYRDQVRAFQSQVESTTFQDSSALQLVKVMHSQREPIAHLVSRANRLGLALRSKSLKLVLCHSDIHAGNLLLGAQDALHIVDWDNPTFSPKERDLILVGGSSIWKSPEYETLFYEGYGPTPIDSMALAYYRYERIIQDIAAYCEQLLLSEAGGADREQSVIYFSSLFLPGYELDIAFQKDHSSI